MRNKVWHSRRGRRKNGNRNTRPTYADYWFHVKNAPGSHAVMVCHGEEPESEDFTDAAEIAAFYASIEGEQKIEVDYTYVKNVKKVPSSRPGFVVYHTNWSCIVTPNADHVAAMRVK